MSVKPSPQVSREADQLEALLDQLPLTGQQREKAWDTWADRGMAAALGVVRRYKESGDALDAPIEALRTAYDAGDQQAIAGALQQLATAVQAPAVTATAKLADDQKPIKAKSNSDQLGDVLAAAVRERPWL